MPMDQWTDGLTEHWTNGPTDGQALLYREIHGPIQLHPINFIQSTSSNHFHPINFIQSNLANQLHPINFSQSTSSNQLHQINFLQSTSSYFVFPSLKTEACRLPCIMSCHVRSCHVVFPSVKTDARGSHVVQLGETLHTHLRAQRTRPSMEVHDRNIQEKSRTGVSLTQNTATDQSS